MENKPELVFGETDGVEIVEQKELPEIKESYSYDLLSKEDQEIVDDFVSKIDITNMTAVSEYGVAAQRKISNTSNTLLEQAKVKDLGEVGNTLSDLVLEIEGFSTEEDKGFLSKIFNKGTSSVKRMATQYEKVEVSIDTIVGELNNHKVNLYKDIAILDEMYQGNLDYFNELNLYIIAGEEKLRAVEELEIPKQREIAETSQDDMEIQKLNDLVQSVERFDKRLHDLKLTRTISIQMAPQIRMIQNNDNSLAEKIQSSITNAIPLWKNQMVLALGLANTEAALKAQREVTDMTDELLRKNSELLKQGTIEVAKESERSIVSIETIDETNKNLIETIEEVLKIQKDGREARQNAEEELERIEGELKQALIEGSNRV